jgi:parvin
LEKIDLKVDDLDTQLDSGVNLIYLMGILEGYFIPLHAFHSEPESNEQKVENCRLLFKLIDDAGLQKPNCSPEEIANGDLKSILRIMYSLFSHYKDRD